MLKSNSKEPKRKLYKAVVNVNILEGIRFYVSFACSFAFGGSKLWRIAKIISLIARDESQHLVLTQNIINKWRDGDDPDIVKIAKEEEQWTVEQFKRTVEEEEASLGYVEYIEYESSSKSSTLP